MLKSPVATAQTMDLILKKGDRAPFNGVFITEYDYRELSKCEESYSSLLTSNMELQYECSKKPSESSIWEKAFYVLLGAGVTALAVGVK